jgi:uncharacterized protein YfiM (DUF2279 family)
MRGLALVLTLQLGARGKGPDPWFSPDKAKHFFMSMFLESVSFSVLRAANTSRRASLAGSTILSASVGIGREIYDYYHPGTPSLKDLTWDAAGIATAAIALHQTAP